uniref:Uncharacterized protein n=1 Tax=Arundo donax TaxID=35708 RepID=A0A0A9ECN0_ARUDO
MNCSFSFFYSNGFGCIPIVVILDNFDSGFLESKGD